MWGRAVVCGVMLLAAGCTSAETAEPSEPAVRVAAGEVPPCPPRDTPAVYPEGPLPAGATSVRLCGGPVLTSKKGEVLSPGFAAPADALVSRVDEAIEAANRSGDTGDDSGFCALPGQDTRHYWFTYPDGSKRAVTVGDESCTVDFEDTFAELLLTQREESEAPGAPAEAPVCSPDVRPLTRLPADRLVLERAVFCVRVAPYERISYRPAELTPSLLERLSQEYDAAEASLNTCRTKTRELLKILAYSDWGDPVELISQGCGRWSRPGEDARWPMSSELQADLRSLPLGPAVSRGKRSEFPR